MNLRGLRAGPALSALIVYLGAAFSLSAAPLLTLLPPDLAGQPGTTVGWGFTIDNDFDYIEITSSQFCVNPVNFPLVCFNPATGAYNDFIGTFQDVIVGHAGGTEPASVTGFFDPVLDTGVASFVIDPAAAGGASDVGQIVLTYNLYDVDPNDPSFDPVADLVAKDVVLAADASVTVAAAPEPATAGLLAIALAVFGLGSRALKSRRGTGA